MDKINKSSQEIDNLTFEDTYSVRKSGLYGFDGVGFKALLSDCMAVKIQTGTNVKYVGLAAPGTAQTTAAWQVFKIDTSSGTVITWADGDANFNNIATDLTTLDYL